MRKVVKDVNDRTEKLKSKATLDALLDIATTKNKDAISDAIYRDSFSTKDGPESHVANQLAISYLNKCAYCERLQKPDIEHYRPKKKVAEDEQHDGYYWLCYEWSNLLPACITCNREGAKHMKFPILGIRVNTPTFNADNSLDINKHFAGSAPLVDEVPLLLHPEVDEPSEFFEFEVDEEKIGIRIVPLETNNVTLRRAKATVDICKLNRQELKLDRKAVVVDHFIKRVNFLLAKFSGDELVDLVLNEFDMWMHHSLDEEVEHTLLRKYIMKDISNFRKIVLPFAQGPTKNILDAASETFFRI